MKTSLSYVDSSDWRSLLDISRHGNTLLVCSLVRASHNSMAVPLSSGTNLNLSGAQLSSLVCREAFASCMFTSLPTQNVSHAACKYKQRKRVEVNVETEGISLPAVMGKREETRKEGIPRRKGLIFGIDGWGEGWGMGGGHGVIGLGIW